MRKLSCRKLFYTEVALEVISELSEINFFNGGAAVPFMILNKRQIFEYDNFLRI